MDIEHLRAKCLPKRKTLESLGLFWDRYFAGKEIENMAEAEAIFCERAKELQDEKPTEQDKTKTP